MYAQALIPVPENQREAVRWALRTAPAGLMFGLAAGWLIGRWKAVRRNG
jgi:hypothetical protein